MVLYAKRLCRLCTEAFRLDSIQREGERKFHYSIQPALAYEDASWLVSSAKLRMAARQWQTAFWSLCHTKHCMVLMQARICSMLSRAAHLRVSYPEFRLLQNVEVCIRHSAVIFDSMC